ncbi:hypothetical protein ABZY93_25735 [Streptomyces smyrnaeus]
MTLFQPVPWDQAASLVVGVFVHGGQGAARLTVLAPNSGSQGVQPCNGYG